MKTNKLLLYELGDILFTAFLKTMGVTETKTFTYRPDGKESIKCTYARLPKGSNDSEGSAIVLIDKRDRNAGCVEVVILKSPPKIERGNVVSHLPEYASVIAGFSSSSGHIEHEGRFGNTTWLRLRSKGPYLGEIDMSYRQSTTYWFKLTEMAFALYDDPAYGWVTSFFKSGKDIVFLEVRNEPIKEKALA